MAEEHEQEEEEEETEEDYEAAGMVEVRPGVWTDFRPDPEPAVEPTVVKRKIIEGKRYLMDKYNNLYDYDAYVRDGTDVIVGLWDPVQDRVVERLIDV